MPALEHSGVEKHSYFYETAQAEFDPAWQYRLLERLLEAFDAACEMSNVDTARAILTLADSIAWSMRVHETNNAPPLIRRLIDAHYHLLEMRFYSVSDGHAPKH